jgi:hypothetical protein
MAVDLKGRSTGEKRYVTGEHIIITITIIIVIIKSHNYTLTYARKQGYNWTKNFGMNMFQNQ